MLENTDNKNNSKNASNMNNNSLSYYPKIEMMIRKEIDKDYNPDTRRINRLISNYIPKSLSETFKSMSNQEKAKIYIDISNKLKKIAEKEVYPLKLGELATIYLNKKLSLNSNNIKNAQETSGSFYSNDIKNAQKTFDSINSSEPYSNKEDIINLNDFFKKFDEQEPCAKGAEIAELYLKSSNNKDTEKRLASIYDYLARYYYSIEDYEKNLEYYKKKLKCFDSNTYEYHKCKLDIARTYYYLGEYGKGLEIIKELKDYEPQFPPDSDKDEEEKYNIINSWHNCIYLIDGYLQRGAFLENV